MKNLIMLVVLFSHLPVFASNSLEKGEYYTIDRDYCGISLSYDQGNLLAEDIDNPRYGFTCPYAGQNVATYEKRLSANGTWKVLDAQGNLLTKITPIDSTSFHWFWYDSTGTFIEHKIFRKFVKGHCP